MVDYSSIGRRISLQRKRKGLTQSAFAERLGVSVSYISQLERGKTKVSLPRLDHIAEILETDISLLFSDAPGNTCQVDTELSQITKDWTKEQKELLIRMLLSAEEIFSKERKKANHSAK